MQYIFKYRYIILFSLFVLTLGAFWPGLIQPDSKAQYAQAITGQYTDHHPPLMSFVWHVLDLLVKGEGLMFALQISMFFAALFILLRILEKILDAKQLFIATSLVLFLPIYPQVFLYALNIVKDVQYTFSFLLAAALLAYYTVHEKSPGFLGTLLLLIVMLYGASVKYQGQFCVIILALWLGALLGIRFKLWQKICFGFCIYGLIFAAIAFINHSLVAHKSKNYAWQYVKLYDLAAISRETQTDLIPAFNKLDAYTFEKLQTRFKYPSVDPYIFSEDNILTITKDPVEMSLLRATWRKNLRQYPFLYLKHRFKNMGYALLSRPGYDYTAALFEKIHVNSRLYTLTHIVVDGFFYIFMSHLLVIILGIIYLVAGIWHWRQSRAAQILVGLTSMALLMVGILFFMSMAGVPRYTYFAIILIHAGHPFAYVCYMQNKQRIKLEKYSQLPTYAIGV